jgi:uncharacterized phage protein (TIGR01671 family)
MNRTIRFRLWDTKHQSFVTEPGYAISLLGTLQIEGHTCIEPQRYVVQQFTGLQDRDGKDIYENDILRIETLFENLIGQVRWGVSGGSICSWMHTETWLIHFVKTPSGILEAPLYPYCQKHGYDVSIISNVYEHPHLLERKEQ